MVDESRISSSRTHSHLQPGEFSSVDPRLRDVVLHQMRTIAGSHLRRILSHRSVSTIDRDDQFHQNLRPTKFAQRSTGPVLRPDGLHIALALPTDRITHVQPPRRQERR